MNIFTIKDIENLSGIKAHTIRIWEQRYQFLKPRRTGTNIRYYSTDELKKILNIALLNKYGFKISHIDKMPEEEVTEKILSLTQLEAQQERTITKLIQCMIDLNMERLEEVIDDYISARGIEQTILQILFPFMDKIGILWITNHINPAQEHLVTNIIRQKLIAGIENVRSSSVKKKSVLLFLPEGEYHELGSLFLCYLLKSRGISVIYLGANVPLIDVEYVANLKKPDYVYTHITSGGQNFNFDKFIHNITRTFSFTPIIISGQLTQTYQRKIPPMMKLKRTFPEVMDFVSSLS